MFSLLYSLLAAFFFFLFNLLWKVFRARSYKPVYLTWNSQDSGCKWKLDPHLCNQCHGPRFWVIGCSFQKARHPPFTLRYLSYSPFCICVQSCHRNLYPKSPVLLYMTLGQLRFSSALQESSCVVILTPSTLLFQTIIKIFKYAKEYNIVNPHSRHSTPHKSCQDFSLLLLSLSPPNFPPFF